MWEADKGVVLQYLPSSAFICGQVLFQPRPGLERPSASPPSRPRQVRRNAGENNCEGDAGIDRVGPERVDHHCYRRKQEKRRNRRVSPGAVRPQQIRSPPPQHEDRPNRECIEGPYTENELVSQLLKI